MTDGDRHFLCWSRYQQIIAYTAFGAFLTGFVFIPVMDPHCLIKGFVTKKWIRIGSDDGLTIGTLEISIPHQAYVKYQAGDGIELRRFTKWGILVVQHRVKT